MPGVEVAKGLWYYVAVLTLYLNINCQFRPRVLFG
jgi:hypothetical protein